MYKPLMLLPAIVLVAACKPFSDSSPCDEAQRAINDANFFILTYLSPLNGDVQIVQIDGKQNNDAGTLRFSQCRWLSEDRTTTYRTKYQSRCLGWDPAGNCSGEYSEHEGYGGKSEESLHYSYTYYPQ